MMPVQINQKVPEVPNKLPQANYNVKKTLWIFIPNPKKRTLLSPIGGITALDIISP